MSVVQGEVAEDEEEAVTEVLLHALDDGIGAAAVGALVISILDESDRGVRTTLRVVAGADGSAEFGQ